MGKTISPCHVKLVIGMIAEDIELFREGEKFFTKEFGAIDYKSEILQFTYTDYYKEEMGTSLNKKFISFSNLINQNDISDIKTFTNLIEDKFTDTLNKRKLNIDPGYLSDAKFVLATTKDYFHRIYLNKGIYGEITLFWQKGGFKSFDWTYPDYKSKEYIDILTDIRNIYMEGINNN